jgi:hypothetical protein
MRESETAVRSGPDVRMPQHDAYGVGLDTCRMVEVDPERFEVMVSEALDGIPGDLGELMSNVAVTVCNTTVARPASWGSTRECH